ncbi:hypothetical protein GOP47_0002891 [Adiantum capillus-veneris]|uniref:Uncharacterized protein n=1 Tax=Adiantum capillus-veneris TaxID=13818 RepID=A0A9D4VCN4_ADICA|nr:hypothetical protein GOP47_0002891 [Adiantum capillus-veneris]
MQVHELGREPPLNHLVFSLGLKGAASNYLTSLFLSSAATENRTFVFQALLPLAITTSLAQNLRWIWTEEATMPMLLKHSQMAIQG